MNVDIYLNDNWLLPSSDSDTKTNVICLNIFLVNGNAYSYMPCDLHNQIALYYIDFDFSNK